MRERAQCSGRFFFAVDCLGDFDDSGVDDRCDFQADIDGDGDVDDTDIAIFVACITDGGPGLRSPVGCASADLNGDGEVNLRDWAVLSEVGRSVN